jgi:hypothetical protein
VVSELYGLERPTADVDILEATKGTDSATLARLAGKDSEPPPFRVRVVSVGRDRSAGVRRVGCPHEGDSTAEG